MAQAVLLNARMEGLLADDQAAAASGAAVITACPHGSDWSMKKCFVMSECETLPIYIVPCNNSD